MITAVLIALMTIALAALVLLPLLAPGQADPLPDDRDPLLQDLEEERDALLGAIRELDVRDDLSEARRAELRARYESKAARVLRALDERREAVAGTAPARPRAATRRPPWALAGLLALFAVTGATLGGFVLPRVGQDATVTTFFEEDLARAERLRDLQRTAEASPSAAAYAELGDAYWEAEDAEGAREAYERALQETGDAPARAYARLGLLALQDDLARATELLEEARERDPGDPNTLGTLGELYFARGDYAAAEAAFEDLVATPEAAEDEAARDRLALLREVRPLAEAAQAEPAPDTLLPLAETLWEGGARDLAADAYFRVLTEFDPNHPTALARVGELLFLAGRNDDALALLGRARDVAAAQDATLPPNALLFLGNAAYTAGDWDLAAAAWEDHLATTDDPGRVPGLIEEARARARGEAPAGDAAASLPLPGGGAADPAGAPGAAGPGAAGPLADAAPGAGAAGGPDAPGAELFARNCASCHGPQGGGGAGPRLAGNPNAGRPASVEAIVRNGRGMMPAFGFVLEDAEIETLRDWVVATFGP